MLVVWLLFGILLVDVCVGILWEDGNDVIVDSKLHRRCSPRYSAGGRGAPHCSAGYGGGGASRLPAEGRGSVRVRSQLRSTGGRGAPHYSAGSGEETNGGLLSRPLKDYDDHHRAKAYTPSDYDVKAMQRNWEGAVKFYLSDNSLDTFDNKTPCSKYYINIENVSKSLKMLYPKHSVWLGQTRCVYPNHSTWLGLTVIDLAIKLYRYDDGCIVKRLEVDLKEQSTGCLYKMTVRAGDQGPYDKSVVRALVSNGEVHAMFQDYDFRIRNVKTEEAME